MTQYSFNFLAPLGVTECKARLAKFSVYREEGDWIEYRQQASVEFTKMGIETPFVVRVMLLEIQGLLVSLDKNQTQVIGQLQYSPHRARLNTVIPLILIFITGLLLVLSVAFNFSVGFCGSGTAFTLAVLLLPALKLHERLWVDGHEYEAIRMIKQSLLQ